MDNQDELIRLRQELVDQKAFTLLVAERLAICSWLLSRCAEKPRIRKGRLKSKRERAKVEAQIAAATEVEE